MASTDAALLAEVRALAPERDVADVLLATRVVGWMRVVGALLGMAMLGLAWAADSWAGVVFALVAIFGLPALAAYGRPPVVLALAADDVLVFDTTRIRHRPDRLVDTVPAASLEIDFPGALSDKWAIGERKIGIARTERSRLQRWSAHPSTVGWRRADANRVEIVPGSGTDPTQIAAAARIRLRSATAVRDCPPVPYGGGHE